jgi:ribonuclease Z
MKRRTVFTFSAGFLACLAVLALLVWAGDQGADLLAPSAEAAGETGSASSTTRSNPSLGVYYPGSEALAPDEMRVVALGTGMPSPRPKQAAACWLVELGNGDKFLFDIGAGCHERLAAQKIPYDEIDKVFIGHLHVDHYGDLASFWLGGTVMNRLTPLRIWGPNGHAPEYGTAYAMDRMQEMYTWDIGTRAGLVDFRGGTLEVHEFPYDAVNKVIFDENGVVIRTLPAIHVIDGAVSFVLEWNGLTFAYSSDTYPNKWWLEHTEGADISIHECFLSSALLISKQGFTPAEALIVGTQAHTSPEQFGRVMSLTKPRLAVGYHFQNDFDTAPEIHSRVRKTYDGPLALAEDYMVFNITRDDLKVRMSAIDEAVWAGPPQMEKQPPDTSKMVPMSEFVRSGGRQMEDVVGQIYAEINERYGTDIEVPGQ